MPFRLLPFLLLALLPFLAAQEALPMKPYLLQYFTPSPQSEPRTRPDVIQKPDGTLDLVDSHWNKEYGWERYALPLGCGWFGAKIFGGVPVERIQITENSLVNPGPEGLNNFCEYFLEMDHQGKEYADYRRTLSLNEAVATVEYSVEGIRFRREMFTSYPDRVAVIRLTADHPGALNGRLFAQIPFCKDFGLIPGNGHGKEGTMTIDREKILLQGKMQYFQLSFEGQLRWELQGGEALVQDGALAFRGATALTVYFTGATNYRMEPRVFLEEDPVKKLAPYPHPHEVVEETLRAAMSLGWEALRQRHLDDYQVLFDTAALDLGGTLEEGVSTEELLDENRHGDPSRYLEELYFQFGRYLLICSSRKGTLPCNLQGIWNVYDVSPWTAGYWHNINVQMNYWPVFSTNLAPLFESYADYHYAYLPSARVHAREALARLRPGEEFEDAGWCIGTGGWPLSIEGAGDPEGHSGPGTGGMTAKLFWDYYDFTRDPQVLKQVYPTLRGMSQYLLHCLREKDGAWLIDPSASPEQMDETVTLEKPVNGWRLHPYIRTIGCAFDQQMTYETFRDTLRAARALALPEDDFLMRLKEILPHLDPVLVGDSGQVKEYREEHQYGEFGERNHRHLSQLIGLVPGSIINENTPGWLEAAKVSLTLRGDESTGWAMAHRLNAWARVLDGQHAYKILRLLLSAGTLPNLWDTHPPFQIDGNLGGTAGIAEMLLQSHAGLVHLLPALPEEWQEGAFRGLCARGGFTLDARWEKGTLTELVIHSKVGGEVVVKGPGLPTQSLHLLPGEERRLL